MLNLKIKQKHALIDRGHDLYETPAEATYALMRAENLPKRILENAVGLGAISEVLKPAGHEVIGGDIVDRRAETTHQDYVGDFLHLKKVPDGVEMILTNPPYIRAAEFAEHALTICPRVILLLRLNFLESARRTAILEGGALARVHIFRNRLPSMHRAGWSGPKVSTAVAYCWFVWDRAHRGPTTLHRISWTPILDAPTPHSATPDLFSRQQMGARNDDETRTTVRP
jgi:hypothetical protein